MLTAWPDSRVVNYDPGDRKWRFYFFLSAVRLRSTCDFNLTIIASVLFRQSKLQTYLSHISSLQEVRVSYSFHVKIKMDVCVDYHFNIAAHFYR